MAAARARAGAGSADWPARLGEPGSPASRWGKRGRGWTRRSSERRSRRSEPADRSPRTGARGSEPRPAGKGPAPGRVGRAVHARCSPAAVPPGSRTGACSPRIGALSSQNERVSHLPESKTASFPTKNGLFLLAPGSRARIPLPVLPLEWNAPSQSGVQPPHGCSRGGPPPPSLRRCAFRLPQKLSLGLFSHPCFAIMRVFSAPR